MRAFFGYFWSVLWGWQTLALAILGLNELSDWLFGRSWKWLHTYKWRVAIVLLIASQAVVYFERPAPPAQAPASPVIAENPDHAGLTERLEEAKKQLVAAEKERDAEKARRERAEQRVAELEKRLDAATRRQSQCSELAAHSSKGRELVAKLRATRAAPETRKEIDVWYQVVCSAMSKAQCEAFLAAPRKSDSWVNYPFDDGGYSQTLRGRTEYLSAQIATLCP